MLFPFTMSQQRINKSPCRYRLTQLVFMAMSTGTAISIVNMDIVLDYCNLNEIGLYPIGQSDLLW